VRTLIGDLKKLARETGSTPAIDTLAQNLDALDEYGSRKTIEVEVITTSALEPTRPTASPPGWAWACTPRTCSRRRAPST
jgi:hypothetical protein